MYTVKQCTARYRVVCVRASLCRLCCVLASVYIRFVTIDVRVHVPASGQRWCTRVQSSSSRVSPAWAVPVLSDTVVACE